MDENTRFLLERMDEHYHAIRMEIAELRDKIDELQGFRQKILGGSMVVSGAVALLVEMIIKKTGG